SGQRDGRAVSATRTPSAEFTITLSATDGVNRGLRCGPAMTILAAAEQAGMVLPSLCETAEKVRLSDGRFVRLQP
ncbi:MAG: hypothetical protein LC777_04180, partial [Actinobacteria bacterium]|nr:hypothetical protein [Actinomycetota bacterium]